MDATAPADAAPSADAPAPATDAAPPAPDAAPSGDAAPPPLSCDGTGSYGLQVSLEVTWDSTSLADPGRGTATFYALVNVKQVDAQSHALTATGQLCGFALPTISARGGLHAQSAAFPGRAVEPAHAADAELGRHLRL